MFFPKKYKEKKYYKKIQTKKMINILSVKW